MITPQTIPIRKSSSGPGSLLESSIPMIGNAGAMPISIFLLMTMRSLDFFILLGLKRASVFPYGGIKTAPAEDSLEKSEAGKKQKQGIPGG